jgi:tyrosine phenol-lyase
MTVATKSKIAPLANSEKLAMENRRRWLAEAHHNTNLLPHSAIAVDLMTDSWAERPLPYRNGDTLGAAQIEAFIRDLYGFNHLLSLVQGRLAEAIVAASVSAPNTCILTNSIFPTAHFHLGQRGSELLDISAEPGCKDYDQDFLGNLDTKKVGDRLSKNRHVACAWIEACPNAAFGGPVSLENIRAIRDMCAERGVPVILDASRLLENVLLYIERRFQDHHSFSVLRDFCASVDVLVLSGTKDFCFTRGGFIATSNDSLFAKLADFSLAFGGALAAAGPIFGKVPTEPFAPARRRLDLVKELHHNVESERVLACDKPGGHGVYIDIHRVLPDFTDVQHTVQSFLNDLYERCGVRGGEHYYSPRQLDANRRIVRLAVPVEQYEMADLAPIAQFIRSIRKNPLGVEALRQTYARPGLTGKFCAHYEPLNLSCGGK